MKTTLEAVKAKLKAKKNKSVDLFAHLESVATEAMVKTQADLMMEYKVSQHTEWDPEGKIDLWQRMLVEFKGRVEEIQKDDIED